MVGQKQSPVPKLVSPSLLKLGPPAHTRGAGWKPLGTRRDGDGALPAHPALAFSEVHVPADMGRAFKNGTERPLLSNQDPCLPTPPHLARLSSDHHHPSSSPTHGLPTQHLAACMLALGPQRRIYTTTKDLGLKGNAGWVEISLL